MKINCTNLTIILTEEIFSGLEIESRNVKIEVVSTTTLGQDPRMSYETKRHFTQLLERVSPSRSQEEVDEPRRSSSNVVDRIDYRGAGIYWDREEFREGVIGFVENSVGPDTTHLYVYKFPRLKDGHAFAFRDMLTMTIPKKYLIVEGELIDDIWVLKPAEGAIIPELGSTLEST